MFIRNAPPRMPAPSLPARAPPPRGLRAPHAFMCSTCSSCCMAARLTRPIYPRRTTAVAPRAQIGRVGCPLSRTACARVPAGLPPRCDNRPFPASSQASTLPALRTSGELQRPPRSTVAIASATPMGARAPDAGTGTCPTGPHALPTSVLWPASCPAGPCTAGLCCWAMSHPGSALRRPRRHLQAGWAIATKSCGIRGRSVLMWQATTTVRLSTDHGPPFRFAVGVA